MELMNEELGFFVGKEIGDPERERCKECVRPGEEKITVYKLIIFYILVNGWPGLIKVKIKG